MLGIVGDSAAGKTTLTKGVVNLLGNSNVCAICSDDYHKYNRKERVEKKITALNPACNYVDIMENHFNDLRQGKAILKPNYNHSTGDFDAPTYVKPSDFVIVEGLLGFHTRVTRDNFDVKVYLDPPEELRHEWKVSRDTAKRGYSREQVLKSIRGREGDSEAFIRPQKKFADIVVQFYPDGEIKNDQRLNAKIMLSPKAPCDEYNQIIESFANKKMPCANGLGKPCVSLGLEKVYGKPFEVIDISGNIGEDETEKLKLMIAKAIEKKNVNINVNLDGVGVFSKGNTKYTSFPLALAQLTIAYFMIHAIDM
jgi:phosphoribulokinase